MLITKPQKRIIGEISYSLYMPTGDYEVAPTKQRVTFYAPKTVLEIIEKVKIERGDDSITDAVCQIIVEYGAHKELQRMEGIIESKFAAALAEITELKVQNETLRDRLSLVESKCASVNRAVSEMQSTYKKE